jgi:hypothetical protein
MLSSGSLLACGLFILGKLSYVHRECCNLKCLILLMN